MLLAHSRILTAFLTPGTGGYLHRGDRERLTVGDGPDVSQTKLDGVTQGITVLWGHTACPAWMRMTVCLGLVPRACILCTEEGRKCTGTPLNREHGACLPLCLLICRCHCHRWLLRIPWCRFSLHDDLVYLLLSPVGKVIPFPIAGVL